MAGAARRPLGEQTKPNKMSTKKVSVGSKKRKSIQWNNSLLPQDSLTLFSGGDQGGFLSLEEIDESDYGLIGEVTETVEEDKQKDNSLSDSKKRKRNDDEVSTNGDEAKKEEGEKEAKTPNQKQKQKQNQKKNDKMKEKKRKKNKNKKENKKETDEKNDNAEDSIKADILDIDMNDDDNDNGDEKEDLSLGEDEVYSWQQLRLHPLLIKSIRRLGFKEPTPIQKACIPPASHQGKDVIGAAETGSGKTLAFGLPILQRLLEEREKGVTLLEENKLSIEKISTETPLRSLIITPTRELAMQVCDHLKQAAKGLDIYVVPVVGGMSSEKQERLLKRRPHIVVGTPGRLWELMSSGYQHLVELNSLSFFVLDEADRMIEHGHFNELQSIIDFLPPTSGPTENVQRKKRQTFVFSATISLSENFRKKLKRGSSAPRSAQGGLTSIENLSERAGMRPDAAVVDLTNESIVASKLEESFIECGEEDKDAYLYYILSVHGQGRTIIFTTSIAALRHLSSILRLLKVDAYTLHAQMQQRARLKSMDRFRGNENGVLVATDVAARGLDIPHVRTVVHYQLPHSAEVYIHRSGRTARASMDGCSIALISPNDKTKFYSLCRSLSKESLKQFPVNSAYMPEVMKRLSMARQVDKIMRKSSQETAKKNWFEKNADALGVDIKNSDSEDERTNGVKDMKNISSHLKRAQQDLNEELAKPLQPRTLSRRYLAGAGVSPELQKQLEQLAKKKVTGGATGENNKKSRFVVIGENLVEPLDALRSSGLEVCVTLDKKKEMHKKAESWKKNKRDEKKKVREQKRQARKQAKGKI